MHLKILVTAGDGIGPEVTNEAVSVLQRCRRDWWPRVQNHEERIGGAAIVQDGSPLPKDTLDAALASDAVLLGAVGGNEFNSLPPDKRPEAGLLQLREALGGFANLRPAFAFTALAATVPCVPRLSRAPTSSSSASCSVASTLASRARGTRTTEAWNTMRYTRDEVVRVARIAFELPSKRRKKVTSVDKANVLEVSQLWRATVTEVAAEYPAHARAPVCRRDGDAPDESAAQLRCGAHRESLRRHSLATSRP